MTGIDFYVLEKTRSDRQLVACQICEKAYKHQHRVYLLVDSEKEISLLDDRLWSFRSGSFVPHAPFLNSEGNISGCDNEVPVLVGQLPAPESHRDVLVNLGSHLPKGYQCFSRVIEIIDVSIREAGRQRFRLYQKDGFPIKIHKL